MYLTRHSGISQSAWQKPFGQLPVLVNSCDCSPQLGRLEVVTQFEAEGITYVVKCPVIESLSCTWHDTKAFLSLQDRNLLGSCSWMFGLSCWLVVFAHAGAPSSVAVHRIRRGAPCWLRHKSLAASVSRHLSSYNIQWQMLDSTWQTPWKLRWTCYHKCMIHDEM